MGWLISLIFLNAQSKNFIETNPHQPYKQTWILTDGETHTTLNETTHIAPIGTWWPELQFCFRDINPAYKSTAPESARCYGFYACPGHKKSKDCEGIQYSFCKSWACVTSNNGEWKWGVSKPDLVKFAFVNGVPWGCRIPLPNPPIDASPPIEIESRSLSLTVAKGTPLGGYKAKCGDLCFINMVDILA
jgi:hypothetical protein